jgi:hypothetical protein
LLRISSRRQVKKEIPMFRLRFAALAVLLAGFGFVCGCVGMHRSLLGRHACPETDCCDVGAVPDGDIPSGGGCCPGAGPAGNVPVLPPPNLAPQNTVPPLTPLPNDRLTPIPRAQPGPYFPPSP